MKMFRYSGCGLRNVWLQNGYEERKTSYGKAVAIQDVEGLHRAIALHVIRSRPRLSGSEFRFLRKELELSQTALGKMFGYEGQTVAIWEKKGNVPKLADRAVRAIYREITEGNASFKEIVERLDDIDWANQNKVVMKETGKGWQAKAA